MIGRLNREIFECECVGPKSWTDLLRLTGLQRNTLSDTCKFLLATGVIKKRVLKKKGHHVEYSITGNYPELSQSTLREIKRLLKSKHNDFPQIRLREVKDLDVKEVRRLEIEDSSKDRRRAMVALVKASRDYAEPTLILSYQLKRRYRTLVEDIESGWPEIRNWPLNFYWCLVRLIDVYGVREGLKVFSHNHARLDQSDFRQFCTNIMWGRMTFLRGIKQ